MHSAAPTSSTCFATVRLADKLALLFVCYCVSQSSNYPQEINFTKAMYPGIFPSSQNPKQQEATYSEKLLVGYRWYDHHKVTPAFPFGHGLVSREIDA